MNRRLITKEIGLLECFVLWAEQLGHNTDHAHIRTAISNRSKTRFSQSGLSFVCCNSYVDYSVPGHVLHIETPDSHITMIESAN